VTSLSVISKGFLAALIGGSVVLWLAVYAIRRRRGRVAVITVASLAFVLSIASAADAVNAHYQYLPRLSDVIGQRDWPAISHQRLTQLSDVPVAATPTPVASVPPQAHGTRRVATRASRGMGYPHGAVGSIEVPDTGVGFAAKRALVYLPPEYFADPQLRFPVTYLFHGSPGVAIDWLRGAGAARAGDLASRKGEPQILVMPTVSRSWLDDSECVDGAHMRVETYVVGDLVPAVDAQLRTKADAVDRTVGGMSAGGYCALNLGLRHRNLFGQIIDMSGFTHPTHAGGMAALFGNRADLQAIVAANSPDVYVDALTPVPPTRLYFLCGTNDPQAMREMASMRDRLRARGFDVSWSTRPGGHTYGVWRPGLIDALDWSGTRPA
jgi:enterochelin esterase-like enzyme